MNVGDTIQYSISGPNIKVKAGQELVGDLLVDPEFTSVFKKWVVTGFKYFSDNAMKGEPEENRIAMYGIVLITLFYLIMAVLSVVYCATGRSYIVFPYGSRRNSIAVTTAMRVVLFSSFIFNLQILHGTVFAQNSVSKYMPAFVMETVSYLALQIAVIIIKGYFIVKKEKKRLTWSYFLKSLGVIIPELIMVYCCAIAAAKVSNIGIVGSLFAAEIIVRGTITLIIWGVHSHLVRSLEKKLKRVNMADDTSQDSEFEHAMRPINRSGSRRDNSTIVTSLDHDRNGNFPFSTVVDLHPGMSPTERRLYLNFLRTHGRSTTEGDEIPRDPETTSAVEGGRSAVLNKESV